MAWNLSDPDEDALIGWDDSEGDVIVYTLGDGIQSTGTVLSTTLVDAADIRGLGFFDITNDGTGSGLDADLLDGNEATAFVTLSGAQTISGVKTFSNGIIVDNDKDIILDGAGGTENIHARASAIFFDVGGSAERIRFSSSGIFIAQSDRLGLDGTPAGDTYIRSPSSNILTLTAGGVDSLVVKADEITFTGTLKNTTGDPTGVEGRLTINTFDNAIKVYADGAWRTLASW